MIALSANAAGGTTLKVEGPLRLVEAEDLLAQSRIVAAASGEVAVDLGDAEHIHAACLQILLALERHCLETNRPFRVSTASEQATEVLELGGVSRWLGPERRSENDA